ncbi:MAG: helix-turn-helix transcriptional regulator [bacterium]|nr:helix-turn-helix transcriptional regulator [bacterium]
MAKRVPYLFPPTVMALKAFGEDLKLARLRRDISLKMMSERTSLSVVTLTQIEKGSPSVSLGNYMQVLFVLGMDQKIRQVAADDQLGRKLQDLNLTLRKRASKREDV